VEVRKEKDETMYPDYKCKLFQEAFRNFLRRENTEREELVASLRGQLHPLLEPSFDTQGKQADLTALFDYTSCARSQHKYMPPCFTDDAFQKLEMASTMRWWSAYAHEEVREIARLGIGRFVGELLQVFKKRCDSNSNLPQPKLAIYSGHDSTIAPLLGAFQCFDNRWPPFASNLIFEMLREKQSPEKYFVRLIYNDRILAIPQCSAQARPGSEGTLCPFERFQEIANRVIPQDYEKECSLTKDYLT